MKLVVFGANGPTGRLVVRRACDAGHHVVAVTRRPAEFPVTGPLVDVVEGDVTDVDAVHRAVAGAEAVISTYGVPYTQQVVTVYSRGITAILGAMRAHGVDRLVCVTSTTVAGDAPPGSAAFHRLLLIPFLRRVIGRTLYDDMERMEATVAATALDWTIVRPGGLFDAEEPTDDYEVSRGRLTPPITSRADLAEVLVREATDPAHSRATVEVVTRSGVPSGTDLFAKNVFGAVR